MKFHITNYARRKIFKGKFKANYSKVIESTGRICGYYKVDNMHIEITETGMVISYFIKGKKCFVSEKFPFDLKTVGTINLDTEEQLADIYVKMEIT